MSDDICGCQIHPFPRGNETVIRCGFLAGHDGDHTGVLADYAHPGSRTSVTWMDTDRRNYTGDWIECPIPGCILPANHRGDHAA